jgi:PAS domain S-box-containing protein
VEFARSYFDPATFVLPAGNGLDVVTAVCKDTVDGAFLTHGELHDLFLNRPQECNDVRLQWVDTPITFGLSIMSHKSDEAIAKRLRKRIDDLVLDGTLLRFATAHPPIPTSGAVRLAEQIRQRYRNRLVTTVGIVLVILITLSLWFLRQKHRDLAKLDATERQLRKVYDRLSLNREIARMGSYEWFVPEGRLELSPELEALCGIPATHTHSVDEWTTLMHPDDRTEVMAGLKGRGASTSDQTYRIIRADGEIRWIHSRRKYEYDSNGNPVHVMGIAMDVTELKQGEIAQEILGGLLHICAACRRIENGDGEWYSMEGYLRQHIPAKFSFPRNVPGLQ